MKIAVFDIDGTLTRSSGVDDASFVRTAREVLGLGEISLDWNTYPHSTDDSIAAHLIARARGRAATRAEIDAFEQAFLRVLGDEITRAGGIEPMPGAERVHQFVRAAGWVPAVATGCWRGSALRKLAAAGLTVQGMGAAFADDAWPREQIIATAVQRAVELAGGPCAHGGGGTNGATGSLGAPAGGAAFDVVYIGDGTWDVRACRANGYRFVGIAEGPRAAALRQEGAGIVLANYADEHAVLDALQHASVPRNS